MQPPPPHLEEALDALSPGFHPSAASLCVRLLPCWRGEDASSLAVTPVTGGITNTLVRVAPPQPGSAAVVLRVFGRNTEVFIDRTRELQSLLQLTAAGFGAPVLATFANGRVEAWLDGARPLEPRELADAATSRAVATLLRGFHAARVAPVAAPSLWPTIFAWLAKCRGVRLADEARRAVFDAISLEGLAEEAARCKALCDATDSPTVYCHNDLLSANLLTNGGDAAGASSPSLRIIDFEYSCYNPRGFDIGNHFNEWAGFECEYERFPTEAAQRSFLAAYLDASTELTGAADGAGDGGGAVSAEATMRRLLAEAAAFSLASHLYWGVWALLQAQFSAIDFDYLAYHGLRMAEFRRRFADVEEIVERGTAAVLSTTPSRSR